MATQFDPIAKDESLNTTESPSRNIADVLAEELSAIEQAIAGGSGSGGHTIVNASGTDMTQRAKMQFVDAEVTDDAVNDVTKISTTPASYPSANVTYGSGSVEDALDELNQNPKFKQLYSTKTALSTSASVSITLPESRNNYTFLYLVVGFDTAQKRCTLIVTAEHNNSFASGYVDSTNHVLIQDVYSSSETALNLHQQTNTASTLNLYKVYGIK